MGSKVSTASQGGATYASSTGISSTGQSSSSPHRQDQTQSITSSLINLVTNRNNASQAPSHAPPSVALRECRPSNAAVRPAYSRSYSTSHSEMVGGHTDNLEPNRGHPEVNRSMSISSNAGVNRSESTGSSSSGGFGHFLSNFSLWRPSVNSDRQRTRSLSHMPDAEAQGGPHPGRDVSPGLVLVSDENRAEVERNNYGRTALARLLPGSSSGTRNRDSLSDRDLTAAQDLLAEASLAGLGLGLGRVFVTHSLPAHIWALNGIKCPVCSKFVMPDDIECHLVMCLTKPRLSYNEDVLAEDKGECVICLEELLQGHTIARLPCLCVYHKNCIDNWFEVNRSCPEHPSD